MKSLLICMFFLFSLKIMHAQSQLLGGNAFLQGNFIEVGVNQCGSFGTTNNAPAGFHARSGAGASPTTNQLNLGFVADIGKDGWTVGTPRYAGDYFLPFTPRVGWGISFNGNHYRVERTGSSVTTCASLGPTVPPFPGNNIGVTNNGQESVATWSGTANGLQLQKIITVKKNALFFTVKIKLKNLSAAPVNDIYYGDYVNPDHGFYNNDVASGNAVTINSIVNQVSTHNQSLVQSIAPNQYYLGIGSKDCRSKVFRGINNYFDPNPANVQQWFDGSIAGIGYTGADNPAFNPNNSIIGISFEVGTLNAGDSTSFLFTYILDAGDFNEALANTAPGFSINNIRYNSNDTAMACANSSIPVVLMNAEDYQWSWLPVTGVSPATGTSVDIAMGSVPVQYIATGTGPCGTIKDTINLIPLTSRLYVDSSIIVSGNGSSWTSPLKTVSEALNLANYTNCVNEIWVKKGTYFPMQNNTTVANSRDSSFRIIRNGIKMYGGFAGTETVLTQRINGANPSILSADIGIAGNNADNSFHVMTIFTLTNDAIDRNTVIDGFTFTAGNANGIADYNYNDTIILNTRAGGIFAWVASPHINNCIIENNVAEGNGGGLYSYLGSGWYDSLLVRNNHVTSLVNGVSHGGGIFNSGGQSLFKNSTVQGNSSTWDGGGFYNSVSASVIESLIIDSNRAVYGGGFYTRGGTDTLLNVMIRGNIASGGNAAVYNIGNTIYTNGLITGNFSPAGSGWGNVGGDAVLTNITIAGNRATGDNAGIYHGFGNMQAHNCIVWNNQAATQPNISVLAPAVLMVSYSNIQGAVYPGTNNINSNPFFLAPVAADVAPTTSGNYRLNACQSSSIDAGNNAVVTSITDIEGNTRIQNAIVDMGAYETNTINYNVTIAANPDMANAVCPGTSISFTATAINAGPNPPAYQWLLNGIAIAGATNPTYVSSALADDDIIRVVMTPVFSCIAAPDTSNSITVNMTTALTPAVSISASQTNICAGTAVNFTAVPVNGGTSPVFQWQINGGNAGTNSSTFSSSNLNNNDVITVILSSNETCLTTNNVLSNTISMQVNPMLTPSVQITGNQTSICQGANAGFSATATNGGSNPVYQWKVNGINEGINSNTFSSSMLNHNDEITVTITSNEACLISNNVSSNSLRIIVNTNVTPSVTISTGTTAICEGNAGVFSATALHAGSNPFYQWKVNGINEGNNSPDFTALNLNNNDIITVTLTSSENCVTSNHAESNSISINVSANPVLSLSADNIEILNGGSTQLHAQSTETIAGYNWTPAQFLNDPAASNPVASPVNETIFTLNATSVAGCLGAASIVIKVVNGPLIANTFSPNNDGINELWIIRNLDSYPDCRLQIFTRTGQLVFESRGYRKPWDGTFKGKSLPVDTYYYILELNNRIGSKPITGYVTIIK